MSSVASRSGESQIGSAVGLIGMTAEGDPLEAIRMAAMTPSQRAAYAKKLQTRGYIAAGSIAAAALIGGIVYFVIHMVRKRQASKKVTSS